MVLNGLVLGLIGCRSNGGDANVSPRESCFNSGIDFLCSIASRLLLTKPLCSGADD